MSGAGTKGTIAELDGTRDVPDSARRHAPRLRMDAAEPYAPVAYGVTIFEAAGQSPSSKFAITPRGASVIEYAVWYDWDIEHLYDLEHVWVHLDEDDSVTAVEASCHGKRCDMAVFGGLPEMVGERPVLYLEPGKHAHWADPEMMRTLAGTEIGAMCKPMAGRHGVHTGNMFAAAGAFAPTAADHRLARLKMFGDAFTPHFDFTRTSDEGQGVALVPWDHLAGWIPARVKALMAELPGSVDHVKAVFLDCGDTLVDEGTERKRQGTDIVLEGEFVPGAKAMVASLTEKGYTLVLVADGPRETFENLLKPAGLWEAFAAHVISGDVGATKPDEAMFDAALAAIGLTRADAGSVVMVGNNLARDIKGANILGLQTTFFDWSDRRPRVPAEPDETPEYTIKALSDLPLLLDMIERGLAPHNREVAAE